jgi:hypothetical protein
VGNADQYEVSIAINPTDPQNLVAGAIYQGPLGIRNAHYASFDGGLTWTEGLLVEPTYPNQADPVVAFCGDGSAVFVSLSYELVGAGDGIFFYRSTDGGLTWPTRVNVADYPAPLLLSDKPWIACDTTGGPYDGRIYVEWMVKDLITSGQVLKLSYSDDAGQTWSAPVDVSDDPLAIQNGGVVTIGLSGEVYLTWVRGNATGGDVLFDVSLDGGATFGPDRVIDQYVSERDRYFLSEGNGADGIDRSTGPYRGTLYDARSDHRNGDNDILVYRSTDGGNTWIGPVRVNDDPHGNGADQFHPALAVDGKGRVIVVFQDQRRDPAGDFVETWAAISRDGGRSFDTNFLVSDVASDTRLNTFLGDYIEVAATTDLIFPMWADLRSGLEFDADAYLDRFPNIFDYDEVRGAAWLDRETLDFEPQDARFGEDLDYDVLSGLVSELRADSGFGGSGCAASMWPAPPFVDTDEPPPDDAFYYLVRVNGPAGVGTYGDGTAARDNVRDPLDESLPGCPP